MDDKRLAEIRARAIRTWDVLVQTMKRTPPVIGTSIPARPNDDLDLLVGDLTEDAKALVAEVDRLNVVIALLRAECGAWRQCDNVRGTQVEGECQREAWSRQAATDAAGITLEPNK